MKRMVLLILLLGFSGALAAESSVWKLQKDGIEFFVAGSCHVLRKSDYPLPKEFDKAYHKVSHLVFETSLDDMQKPQTQQQLMMQGLYMDGRTIKDVLSASAYSQLLSHLKQNNLPIEPFKTMKPWMLSLTLMFMELQKNGISPTDGVDLYFNNRAKSDGKSVSGLVPVEEHLKILSSISEGMEDSLIKNHMEEMAQLLPIVNDLIAAWKSGDENKIDHFMSENMRKEYPDIYKRLLTDRNKKWRGYIEKLIRSGKNTMVIVGVGHLVGQDSVLKMLAQSGYRFEKL